MTILNSKLENVDTIESEVNGKITLKEIAKNIKELFTLDYYKEGLSGWSTITKVAWLIGFIVILTTGLIGGLGLISVVSIISGIVGYTCVLAITNGKRINGLLGLISAIGIGAAAIHAGNPADALMQLAYLIALDIPVIIFGNRWNKKAIRTADKNAIKIMVFVGVIGFASMYFLDASILHTQRPILDAVAATIGFVGSGLMLGKYSTQYVWWIGQSILSLTLWGITATQGDANWVLFATYGLYLLNGLIGRFNSPWSKVKKSQIKKAQIKAQKNI